MRSPALFVVLLCAACGADRVSTVEPGGVSAGADSGVEVSVAPFTPAPVPVPPAPRRGPPYPVVFVHGMAGFDALKIGGLSMDYFGHTVQDLQARGEDVHRVILPPFDDSLARARALEHQLQDLLWLTRAEKLNLVAHSQGGLDARLLISPGGLGWGDRIATLVTISTPHRGTQVADVMTGVGEALPEEIAQGVFDGLAGLLQRSVYDVQTDPHLRAQLLELTTRHTREVFNPGTPDDPRVRYLSWAGRSNLRAGLGVCDGAAHDNQPWKLDVLLPLFSGAAVATEFGFPPKVSDGLVTVESAKWGTFQGCVPADHLDEVGMPNLNAVDLSLFDSQQFFRDVVAELRAHGH